MCIVLYHLISFIHYGVCVLQGVPQLAICLAEETQDQVKAATAWALGQIGSHTPEHAQAVALANILPKLLMLYLDTHNSEDLQVKVYILIYTFTTVTHNRP